MILLEPVASDPALMGDLALFAGQLEAAGLRVTLARERIPQGLTVTQRFELMRFVEKSEGRAAEGMMLIGAEAPEEQVLARLRDVTLTTDAPVLALGSFDGRLAAAEAGEEIGYAVGRDVQVLDLNDYQGVQAGKRACPCFGVEVPTRPAPFLRGRKAVAVIGSDTAGAGLFPALHMLSSDPRHAPVLYLSSADKEAWLNTYGFGAQVYAWAEMTPLELASLADVVIVTGRSGGNYRMLAALNNFIAKGALIVDASAEGELIADGVPALRGPGDAAYLAAYLRDVVLPSLDGLRTARPRSPLAESVRMDRFLEETPFTPAPVTPSASPRKIAFLPTNGIGLGHAQRTSLVAGALPEDAPTPRFFAFPSCLPMIQGFGFDVTPMIPKTEQHDTRAVNDLANYARLTFSLTPDDLFVFDGGYVFSSVLRTVLDHRLRAVWIRRGLWKQDQNNRVPLDREKVFEKVIVPGEALGDPTGQVSDGPHVHHVGPIVQVVPETVTREAVHAMLKEKFGMEFDRLVVTMLGSGILSDRTAHAQAVAAFCEGRDDILNLMVVWPTSHVPAAWYNWRRTRVVQTHHAALLTKAADMYISAVGFNSFHESLYNRVPALFVPQSASTLDDQVKRAELAEQMGLAAVLPEGRLGLIEREMRRFLDRGRSEQIRAALGTHPLPEPGNRAAAEILAEMAR